MERLSQFLNLWQAGTRIKYFQEINRFVKFSLQQPQFVDQYCISSIHIFSGRYSHLCTPVI